jgi:hypothetical protein
MAINQKSFTYDALHLLKASGAVTSTGASSILDLGAARWDGRVIVDVSALDTASADESYELRVQVSNSSTFASGIQTVGAFKFGDSSLTGGSADSTTGRFELGVSNEYNGTTYRYIRINAVIAGTTPTITYAAYLAPGVR